MAIKQKENIEDLINEMELEVNNNLSESKELQRQLSLLNIQFNEIKNQKEKKSEQVKIAQSKHGKLLKEFKLFKSIHENKNANPENKDYEHEKISVTDHAIIRYLERNNIIDIGEISRKILTPKLVLQIEKDLGNGNINDCGMNIIYKNYKIVTILKSRH